MLRFLTAGESHGPKLSVIIEGLPAGIRLDFDALNASLQRRQKGSGAGPRMSIESDEIICTAGVLQKITTGGPICLEIINKDFVNWNGKKLAPITIPRPGHADLTGCVKYGYNDLRIASERSSARETSVRVAVGGVCQLLLEQLGIHVHGYVVQIGNVATSTDSFRFTKQTISSLLLPMLERADASPVRCPFDIESQQMDTSIQQAAQEGDSLGGTLEIIAWGVPPGLGSFVHYDRRLDSKIAQTIMSIPAVRGITIGDAVQNVTQKGSQINDPIEPCENGSLLRPSNYAGGIEGGISNGEPIIIRVYMKPIPTFPKGLPSVDLATGQAHVSPFQRSDVCPVPRAVPVAEAMLAITLTSCMLEKLGGDSVAEMLPRVSQMRKTSLKDLKLSQDLSWTWEY